MNFKNRIAAFSLALLLLMGLCAVPASAYGEHWIASVPQPTDYAYSLMVVGDTQVVCDESPDGFKTIYDWILSNYKAKKTKMVIGLGDITEHRTDIAEWNLAYDNISRLFGKVPVSLLRGNHDEASSFNSTFYELTDDVDGYYQDGDLINTYQLLTVGDVHYLILALDFGPSNDVLKWAGEVCKAHPGYNVIVTTHGYLDRDGVLLKKGQSGVNDGGMAYHGGLNGGEEIWDQLVSRHKNIVMVLCGHVGENGVEHSVRIGKAGNPIVQMLINPQSIDDQHKLTGMVTTLYFSKDGKKVTVHNYSTIQKQYYGQPFTVSVNKIAHTHAAVDDTLHSDAAYHWKKCPCGAVVEKTAHKYIAGGCVCGKTGTADSAPAVSGGTAVTTTPNGSLQVDESVDGETDNTMMIVIVAVIGGGVLLLVVIIVVIVILLKKK